MYDFFTRSDVLYSFIDIHNHSLYKVDDGASSLETMMSMIDIAYSDNIKTICFTPHFKIYRFSNDEDINAYNALLKSHFSRAQEYAKEKYPDMNLFLACEIMYHNDIIDSIVSGKCSTMGNSRYILVEFFPHVSKHDLITALSNISRRGYRPILAHFERYNCIADDFSLLKECKDSGALIQINALSILKFKIGKSSMLAKKALKKHLVDIVATDAHDNKSLTPILSRAHDKVAKKYGADYAKRIFHDNQEQILKASN